MEERGWIHQSADRQKSTEGFQRFYLIRVLLRLGRRLILFFLLALSVSCWWNRKSLNKPFPTTFSRSTVSETHRSTCEAPLLSSGFPPASPPRWRASGSHRRLTAGSLRTHQGFNHHKLTAEPIQRIRRTLKRHAHRWGQTTAPPALYAGRCSPKVGDGDASSCFWWGSSPSCPVARGAADLEPAKIK